MTRLFEGGGIRGPHRVYYRQISKSMWESGPAKHGNIIADQFAGAYKAHLVHETLGQRHEPWLLCIKPEGHWQHLIDNEPADMVPQRWVECNAEGIPYQVAECGCNLIFRIAVIPRT